MKKLSIKLFAPCPQAATNPSLNKARNKGPYFLILNGKSRQVLTGYVFL